MWQEERTGACAHVGARVCVSGRKLVPTFANAVCRRRTAILALFGREPCAEAAALQDVGGSICVGASKAFEPEVRFSCVTLCTLPCRTDGGSPQRSCAQNIIVGKRELTGTDNKHGFCSWLWRACAAMLLNIRAFVNKAGRERCCVCHAIYIMPAA